MGKQADYTLKQAVAMVNFTAEQITAHEKQCEQCLDGWLYQDGDYCQDGQPLYSNRLKWLRKCKYAAKREGVRITI